MAGRMKVDRDNGVKRPTMSTGRRRQASYGTVITAIACNLQSSKSCISQFIGYSLAIVSYEHMFLLCLISLTHVLARSRIDSKTRGGVTSIVGNSKPVPQSVSSSIRAFRMNVSCAELFDCSI